MIGNSLRDMRPRHTLSVITRTITGGKYVNSNLYTGIVANRQQKQATELATDGGAVVVISDLFTIYPQADGTLPAIEEKHIISDGTNSYEVMMVQNLEMAPAIHVYTRRLR